MTFFGLKSGQDLENRAAHPHQEFSGVPPQEKPLAPRGGYQNCKLMLTVKKFHGISNLTISGNFHRLLAAEETLEWKNQFPYCQKHSLDIAKPYNLFISENISKFY